MPRRQNIQIVRSGGELYLGYEAGNFWRLEKGFNDFTRYGKRRRCRPGQSFLQLITDMVEEACMVAEKKKGQPECAWLRPPVYLTDLRNFKQMDWIVRWGPDNRAGLLKC